MAALSGDDGASAYPDEDDRYTVDSALTRTDGVSFGPGTVKRDAERDSNTIVTSADNGVDDVLEDEVAVTDTNPWYTGGSSAHLAFIGDPEFGVEGYLDGAADGAHEDVQSQSPYHLLCVRRMRAIRFCWAHNADRLRALFAELGSGAREVLLYHDFCATAPVHRYPVLAYAVAFASAPCVRVCLEAGADPVGAVFAFRREAAAVMPFGGSHTIERKLQRAVLHALGECLEALVHSGGPDVATTLHCTKLPRHPPSADGEAGTGAGAAPLLAGDITSIAHSVAEHGDSLESIMLRMLRMGVDLHAPCADGRTVARVYATRASAAAAARLEARMRLQPCGPGRLDALLAGAFGPLPLAAPDIRLYRWAPLALLMAEALPQLAVPVVGGGLAPLSSDFVPEGAEAVWLLPAAPGAGCPTEPMSAAAADLAAHAASHFRAMASRPAAAVSTGAAVLTSRAAAAGWDASALEVMHLVHTFEAPSPHRAAAAGAGAGAAAGEVGALASPRVHQPVYTSLGHVLAVFLRRPAARKPPPDGIVHAPLQQRGGGPGQSLASCFAPTLAEFLPQLMHPLWDAFNYVAHPPDCTCAAAANLRLIAQHALQTAAAAAAAAGGAASLPPSVRPTSAVFATAASAGAAPAHGLPPAPAVLLLSLQVPGAVENAPAAPPPAPFTAIPLPSAVMDHAAEAHAWRQLQSACDQLSESVPQTFRRPFVCTGRAGGTLPSRVASVVIGPGPVMRDLAKGRREAATGHRTRMLFDVVPLRHAAHLLQQAGSSYRGALSFTATEKLMLLSGTDLKKKQVRVSPGTHLNTLILGITTSKTAQAAGPPPAAASDGSAGHSRLRGWTSRASTPAAAASAGGGTSSTSVVPSAAAAAGVDAGAGAASAAVSAGLPPLHARLGDACALVTFPAFRERSDIAVELPHALRLLGETVNDAECRALELATGLPAKLLDRPFKHGYFAFWSAPATA